MSETVHGRSVRRNTIGMHSYHCPLTYRRGLIKAKGSRSGRTVEHIAVAFDGLQMEACDHQLSCCSRYTY